MHENCRGFTLIEIMVVTALISILLGVMSALVTHFERRFALRKATVEISAALKVARNCALEERTFVRIDIDAGQGSLEFMGSRITGYWHFEDAITTGCLGRNGHVEGAALDAGKIGNCLRFSGKARVRCGPLSHTDVRDGFLLSFWVYPEAVLDRPQTLCQLGDLCQVQMDPTRSLFYVTPGQIYPLHLDLPLYRWSYLEMLHERDVVCFSLNYIASGYIPAEKKLKTFQDSPLYIGGFFFGKIDEVRLSALTPLQTVVLPDEIRIVRAPERILINRYAQLDHLVHVAPETIILETKIRDQVAVSRITIGITGDVDYQTP